MCVCLYSQLLRRREIALLLTASYLIYDFCLCLWHWVRCARLQARAGHGILITHALCAQRVFWDVATLLHHVAVVTAFLTGTTWTFGTFHMSTLLLNELSTPFVNARCVARHSSRAAVALTAVRVCRSVALLAMGKQQSSLYAVNGWCMALSFFFARCALVRRVACTHPQSSVRRDRILFGTAVVIHVGITYWVMVPREWHKMFLPLRIVTVSLAIITLCHAALNYWWFSRIVAHVLRAMKRSTKAAASAGSPTPAVAAKAVAAGGEAAGEVVSECSEPAATPVEAAVDRLIAPTPDSARSLPLLERTAARARAGAKAR